MSIPWAMSVTLHRFVIRLKITEAEIAMNVKNCVLTNESDWRCTHYGEDFTSNIFVAKKLPYSAIVVMSFSKQKSFSSFSADFKSLFGDDIELEDFTLINDVRKFYTPCYSIALNKLESVLHDDDKDMFIKRVKKKGRKAPVKPAKIRSYALNGCDPDDTIVIGDDDGTAPSVSMDQQKFSALAIHPFPKESNFVIEIFATGNLNCAGIPSEEYFQERIIPYVNGPLLSMLKECSLEYGKGEIDQIRDEFDFFF